MCLASPLYKKSCDFATEISMLHSRRARRGERRLAAAKLLGWIRLWGRAYRKHRASSAERRPLVDALLIGRRRPTCVTFEPPVADGVDLRPLPLRERKARLAA